MKALRGAKSYRLTTHETVVPEARRALIYGADAIPEGHSEKVCWLKQVLPEWCVQMPCRGCGEHFLLTEEEVMDSLDRGAPMRVNCSDPSRMLEALLRDMALFCFRCKARRIAEGRAARGETLQ